MGGPGGSKLTWEEQRAHFALWAIIKTPLLIGADLRCGAHVAELLTKPIVESLEGSLRTGSQEHWRVLTRKLKKDELLLLKSKEVIAINQDPLGVAGDRVWKQGPYEARACVASWDTSAASAELQELARTAPWE